MLPLVSKFKLIWAPLLNFAVQDRVPESPGRRTPVMLLPRRHFFQT